jgi:hypothetical protein
MQIPRHKDIIETHYWFVFYNFVPLLEAPQFFVYLTFFKQPKRTSL